MPNPQNQVRKVEIAIERPQDKASREGNVSFWSNESKTITAGTNDTIILYNNTFEEGPKYLQTVTQALIEDTYTDALETRVQIRNAANEIQSTFFGNPQNFPMGADEFGGPIRLPEDWDVHIYFDNATASDVTVGMSAVVRDEVIDE